MSGSTQPLEIICPNCGGSNAPGMNFCNRCGQSLVGVSARVPGGYSPPPTQQFYTPPQPQPQQQQQQPYYPPQPQPQQPQQVTYVMPPQQVMQAPYPPQYAQQPVVVINQPQKSVGLAFLLTFLFGPLGLFYSSVVGGITMILVSIVSSFLFTTFVINRLDYYDPGFTSNGVTWLSVLPCGIAVAIYVICIVWGVAAASAHNSRAQTTIVR